MPGFVTPIGDERENLLGHIDQQRDALRYAAFGLTDEQARKTLPPSSLSIGGLLKHVTLTERGRVATMQQLPGPTYDGDEFALPPDETLADVLADLAVCGEETAAAVHKLPMDAPVPVPPGTGWERLGIDTWTVRWVLGHLIEELARHAGHADLIRESIDGRTARELRAMAGGRKPP